MGYSTGAGPFVLSSKDAAKDIVQFLRGPRRGARFACGVFEADHSAAVIEAVDFRRAGGR